MVQAREEGAVVEVEKCAWIQGTWRGGAGGQKWSGVAVSMVVVRVLDSPGPSAPSAGLFSLARRDFFWPFTRQWGPASLRGRMVGGWGGLPNFAASLEGDGGRGLG